MRQFSFIAGAAIRLTGRIANSPTIYIGCPMYDAANI